MSHNLRNGNVTIILVYMYEHGYHIAVCTCSRRICYEGAGVDASLYSAIPLWPMQNM